MAQGRAAVGLLRPVAIAVAMLLALLWFVFVLGAPSRPATLRTAAPLRSSPQVDRKSAVHVVEPPPEKTAPLSEEEPEPPTLKLTGPAPFVRRLEAGDYLMYQGLVKDAKLAAAIVRRVRPHLLHNDGSLPSGGLAQLRFLRMPRRDTMALRLTDPDPTDPLGTAMPLRIWTLGEPYPKHELTGGEQLLTRLAQISGKELKGGADVLATPLCGLEVFPRMQRPSGVLGVYFLRDRYCVIRTSIAPMWRFEVLKHELAHAYCRGFTRRFISSRFVSEGLAEYLRYLRPGDDGLRFPPERMKDNLLTLHLKFQLLRQRGHPIDRLRPRRLVGLTPRQFYALRDFGYLVAQATMGYVGGDVIERAFRDHSTKVIEQAIKEMSWHGLLDFVARGGKGGRGGWGIVVNDLEYDGTAKAQETLQVLGVDGAAVPGDVLSTSPKALLFHPKMVEAVVEALDAADGPVVICSDRSEAMDREGASGETGREVVWKYRTWLAEKKPRLVGLGRRIEAIEWRDLYRIFAYDSRNLPRWLERNKLHHAALIIAIAGSSRRRFGMAELLKHNISPAAVLVIDLAEEGGDARRIALAFAARQHYRGLVAYLRPEGK